MMNDTKCGAVAHCADKMCAPGLELQTLNIFHETEAFLISRQTS